MIRLSNENGPHLHRLMMEHTIKSKKHDQLQKPKGKEAAEETITFNGSGRLQKAMFKGDLRSVSPKQMPLWNKMFPNPSR